MSQLKEQLEGSLAVVKKEKLPTVLISGKEYTLVKDRILYFNQVCPNGSIRTEIISPLTEDRFIIRAIVTPDADYPSREYYGHSQAIVGDGYINKTAALENAETSAIGRALAMMGIGVIESIASVDEIHKAKSQGEVEEAAKLKAAELRVAVAEKSGNFSIDGDVLTCKIVGIQKKQMSAKTKTPGKEFRSVTFNGRLPNGANYASVFDTELYEPLDAALDRECKLRIEVKGAYVNIKDVVWIAGIGSEPLPEFLR